MTWSRRRVLRTLAGVAGGGVALAATGVGGLLLADRLGADPDDGDPLYVARSGTGARTLAFLPGHGGTTRYYGPRVAPLAATHRLLLVDLLGFGRSPKPWVPYTVDRHVAELRRVLGRHAPLTLVGHSLGARLAVTYAARHPEDVEALVLIGLPYFGGAHGAHQHFAHGDAPGRWIATRRPLIAVTCVVVRRVLGPILPRLQPALPPDVVADLRQHHWQSDMSTLWESIYHYDLSLDAPRLRPGLPVLCLHGSEDRTAPLEGVRRFAAAHAGTSVRVLEGADHHPLLRDPAWCRAAIAAWPPRG